MNSPSPAPNGLGLRRPGYLYHHPLAEGKLQQLRGHRGFRRRGPGHGARRPGGESDQIHLLAAAGKASYDIPYFADGLEEIIKAGMLGEKE